MDLFSPSYLSLARIEFLVARGCLWVRHKLQLTFQRKMSKLILNSEVALSLRSLQYPTTAPSDTAAQNAASRLGDLVAREYLLVAKHFDQFRAHASLENAKSDPAYDLPMRCRSYVRLVVDILFAIISPALICVEYNQKKADDGFLYITYSAESTFG